MVEKVTVIYRKRGIFSKEVGGAAVNYNNGKNISTSVLFKIITIITGNPYEM